LFTINLIRLFAMKVYLAIHFVHCLITGDERGESQVKTQK
jgi:hypothetical protein